MNGRNLAYALCAILLTPLAPWVSIADTVIGTAILNHTILQPGAETRKKLRSSTLREINNAIEQSSSGVTTRQAGDEIWVEIVRVQTRGGNDPLNASNPTTGGDTTGRATGGSTGGTTGGGGTGGGASFTCTPNTSSGGTVVFLNPTMGTCSTAASGVGGGAGETEAFDFGFGAAFTVQTNPAVDFRFVQVPALATVNNPGISWSVPTGTTTSWTLQQTSTGKQWRISLTSNAGGTATINSITPL